eukprot:Gb_29808 [translate_table: standard]
MQFPSLRKLHSIFRVEALYYGIGLSGRESTSKEFRSLHPGFAAMESNCNANTRSKFLEVYNVLKSQILTDSAFQYTDDARQWIEKFLRNKKYKPLVFWAYAAELKSRVSLVSIVDLLGTLEAVDPTRPYGMDSIDIDMHWFLSSLLKWCLSGLVQIWGRIGCFTVIEMLDYTVPGGKLNRGLSVIDSYRLLKTGKEITEDEVFLGCVLGWCIEWVAMKALFDIQILVWQLQAYFLVLDDIMDGSHTRRGQPCWFRLPQICFPENNDVIMWKILDHVQQKSGKRHNSCSLTAPRSPLEGQKETGVFLGTKPHLRLVLPEKNSLRLSGLCLSSCNSERVNEGVSDSSRTIEFLMSYELSVLPPINKGHGELSKVLGGTRAGPLVLSTTTKSVGCVTSPGVSNRSMYLKRQENQACDQSACRGVCDGKGTPVVLCWYPIRFESKERDVSITFSNSHGKHCSFFGEEPYLFVLPNDRDTAKILYNTGSELKGKVGLIAANDGILLRTHISRILKLHFQTKPYYVDLCDLFNEVEFQTASGQMLDLITTHEGAIDLAKYKMPTYLRIVQYKTAYYSFYLPVRSYINQHSDLMIVVGS